MTIQLDGPRLQLNALFIQPTRWCARNCKGCYVKAHQGGEDGYYAHQVVFCDLLKILLDGHSVHSHQITISFDKQPSDRFDRMTAMQAIFQFLLTRRFSYQARDTQLHGTFHTISDAESYGNIEELGIVLDVVNFSQITLTDSNIRYLGALRMKCEVNLFHRIPPNIDSGNIESYISNLIWLGEHVDNIYLVVNKSPVAKSKDIDTRIRDKAGMRHDLSIVDTIRKRGLSSIRAKVVLDGCITDTLRYRRTGMGCSSSVSRFQVWPDGTVSGCPYAYTGIGTPARSATDIVDNIRKARERYDFDMCHLPGIYNSLYGRPKNRGNDV